jgi:O-antigen ligase
MKKLLKNKFSYFFIIILTFIPLLLISGPFLPDLLVNICSLGFLFICFRDKRFDYFNFRAFYIFLAFCFVCVLSSLFADDILLSFESSLFYFRFGFFACLVWYLIDQNKLFLKYFFYSLVAVSCFLIFDGYFQFLLGFNVFGQELIDEFHVTSIFDRPKLGSYLSRLFPLLLALMIVLKVRDKYLTIFGGLLFILIDVLVYLTGERTSFMYMMLSSIFIVLLIDRLKYIRLITLLLSLALIVGITSVSPTVKKRMVDTTLEQVGVGGDKIVIFSPNHDSHIRTAFNMFLDKPILGHGPKMFRVKCSDLQYAVGINPCSTHPHNFYVQLLAETGIIGFLFLFSAFGYVLYCAYRQLKSIILKETRYLTDYQVCLLAGILITVWPFSPNGNFFNNWLAIVYSLPVGFYLQSIYSKKIRNYKKPA